jgi:hypothetical protein
VWQGNVSITQNATRRAKTWPHLFALAVFVAMTVWFYGDVLLQGKAFGFRDTAHFYYPVFEYQRREIFAGRFPYSTDRELLGYPLAADATSCTFYPGKLVFLLPGNTHFLMGVFLAAHQFLAAVFAYGLALAFRRSVPASMLAAVAYSFCGTVLFQHCNVVFLISAAWLPLAIGLGDAVVRRGSLWSAIGLAAVLAMMVLGGDPQMAYHVGLLLGIAVMLSAWNRWRRRHIACENRLQVANVAAGAAVPEGLRPTATIATRFKRMIRAPIVKRLALLLFAGGMGGLFAAAQIIPTAKLSSLSFRNLRDRPRNIYEAFGDTWANSAEENKNDEERIGFWVSCFEKPPSHRQQGHVYQFSTPPWKYLELAGGNLGGQFLPIHRRWLRTVPASARVWTPSLYLGLPTLILGIVGLGRIRSARSRWLRFVLIYAVIASLGTYGVGWLIKEVEFGITGEIAHTKDFNSAAGGLYWLMVKTFPYYVMFRFPAKWLVISSLIMSLLAARGLDRTSLRFAEPVQTRQRTWCDWLAVGLCILLAISSVAILLAWPWITAQATPAIAESGPDSIFGPLEAEGCLADIWNGLIHLLIVLAVLAIVGLLMAKRFLVTPQMAVWIIFGLTCVDLAVVHRNLTYCVPRTVFEKPGVLADVPRPEGHTGPLRFVSASQGGLYPEVWKEESSQHRMAALAEFDRATYFSRLTLLEDVTRIDGSPTLKQAAWSIVMAEARKMPSGKNNSLRLPTRTAMDLLGIDAVIVPADKGQDVLKKGWLPGGKKGWRIWQPGRGWLEDDTRLQKPIEDLIANNGPNTPTPLSEKAANHVVVLVRRTAASREWDDDIKELLELPVKHVGAEDAMRQRVRALLEKVKAAE